MPRAADSDSRREARSCISASRGSAIREARYTITPAVEGLAGDGCVARGVWRPAQTEAGDGCPPPSCTSAGGAGLKVAVVLTVGGEALFLCLGGGAEGRQSRCWCWGGMRPLVSLRLPVNW